MLGGLMRLDELQRRARSTTRSRSRSRETRKGVFSWPAQRTDGILDRATPIPEGTRFRLDPDLDLTTMPMAPVGAHDGRGGAEVRDRRPRQGRGDRVLRRGSHPHSGPTRTRAPPVGSVASPSSSCCGSSLVAPAGAAHRPPADRAGIGLRLRRRSHGGRRAGASSDMRIEQSGSAITISDPARLDAVGTSCTQVDGYARLPGATSPSASVETATTRSACSRRCRPPSPVGMATTVLRVARGWRRSTAARHDSLSPGLGADRLNGGDGNDTADYGARAKPRSCRSTVRPMTARPARATPRDRRRVADRWRGRRPHRRLGGADGIWAQAGDDTVDGGGGGDWLNGGAGIDTADYSSRLKAVTLSLDDQFNDGEAGETTGSAPTSSHCSAAGVRTPSAEARTPTASTAAPATTRLRGWAART